LHAKITHAWLANTTHTSRHSLDIRADGSDYDVFFSAVQGADKTLVNKAGMSPVAVADKSKRVEIVNALAAHSMDQKAKVVEVVVKDANNGGTNPPDEPKQP
jgi:heterodisulfide reductase subunit A-like polyferredoxin